MTRCKSSVAQRQRFHRSQLENLENRQMLSIVPPELEQPNLLAADIGFAHINGSIEAPGEVERIDFSIGSNFSLAGKNVRLGFFVERAETSAVDPHAVKIFDYRGKSVKTEVSSNDLRGLPESLVLADLKRGDYTIEVRGTSRRGPTGAFVLHVYLAGDVNGDFRVTTSDVNTIKNLDGTRIGSSKYREEADVNLDGKIDKKDQQLAKKNVGDSVSALPLSLTIDSISPAPVVLPGGVLATQQAASQVNGTATAGATVTLDKDGDGFDDGSVLVGAGGSYSLPATLVEGLNTLRVQATKSGSVSQTASIQITLDTQPPPTPSFNLDPNDDSVPVGDLQTTFATVKLIGATSPNTAVTLLQTGVTTISNGSGGFEFVGVALAMGENTFTTRATDAVGNQSTASVTITRLGGDTTAPTIVLVQLINDTGTSNADRISSDPRVSGYIIDENPITAFRAGFDATPEVSFLDVLVEFQPDATFSFNVARLEAINGGPLLDGAHTLHLQATDSKGNVSGVVDFVFTLATIAPLAPQFDLSATSDTGTIGDHVTSAARVTLTGQAAPNQAMELVGLDRTTISSNTGQFVFADVGLSMISNVFMVRTTDVAGNTSEFTRTIERLNENAQPDSVLRWNLIALDALRTDASTPPFASRLLALMHLAIYDVVAAIEKTAPYYVLQTAPADTSPDAAIASAAYEVLRDYLPGRLALLDQARASALGEVLDGSAKTDGIALGQSIATAILHLRAADGWEDYVDYQPGIAVGQWQPTGPMFDVALLPQWANLEPFAMDQPDQFRPPGPPSLGSVEYATAFNEVKTLGRIDSTLRTAEQKQIARFWADGPGTYTPPGHWNQIASDVAQLQGNSLSTNARLMAQLNVAMADATIVAWDAKYHYDTWRPVTAIQSAADDGDPLTEADSAWQPLLITPSFPEYVSGHSTFSGAAAEILTELLGGNVSFTIDSFGLPGVERSFSSFQTAAEEAGQSRIYGGIHFQFANQDGLAAGRELAKGVLSRFATTTDTIAPAVLIESPAANLVINSPFNVTGRVIDNLAGVASLQYALDGGPLTTIAFDSLGRFTLPVALPLNGSADGLHHISLVATDAVGNIAQPVVLDFTLDTAAPVVNIVSPTVDTVLAAGAGVAGIVDGTGSAIVSLSYAWDGGSSRPLQIDQATGSFASELDLSRLAAGSHSLVVTAVDAAGNASNTSVNVSLAARIPFAITDISPLPGSRDVGSTFRPQVFFSRPVNPASLNSTNFFATDTTGATIPATIVPAQDGTFAWLFFNEPLPGASTITIHVVGDTILAQADGQPLDADQNGVAGGTRESQFTTVPPELVRDMLPPGVLQHTFDITIQAPGAATFGVPLELTFPNVFDAAPGTQLNFLSFDHTTGRLVIDGTATVSADGLSVVTDPGNGITKPGWHGLPPPGGPVGPKPPPKPPPLVCALDQPVPAGIASLAAPADAVVTRAMGIKGGGGQSLRLRISCSPRTNRRDFSASTTGSHEILASPSAAICSSMSRSAVPRCNS